MISLLDTWSFDKKHTPPIENFCVYRCNHIVISNTDISRYGTKAEYARLESYDRTPHTSLAYGAKIIGVGVDRVFCIERELVFLRTNKFAQRVNSSTYPEICNDIIKPFIPQGITQVRHLCSKYTFIFLYSHVIGITELSRPTGAEKKISIEEAKLIFPAFEDTNLFAPRYFAPPNTHIGSVPGGLCHLNVHTFFYGMYSDRKAISHIYNLGSFPQQFAVNRKLNYNPYTPIYLCIVPNEFVFYTFAELPTEIQPRVISVLPQVQTTYGQYNMF